MAYRKLANKRSFATLVQRGFNEVGKGGRSSASGLTAVVFGGTGFLGKYLMFELGKTGYRVYLPNRGDQEEVRHLKVAFDLGQWAALPYSIRDDDSIKRTLEGADIVINLIGKHYETKHAVPYRNVNGKLSRVNYTFEEVHVEAPAKIAELAKAAGIERFIHVSALGASEDSPSKFLSTKAKGEAALKSVFPQATIVRPGKLYGPEDRLFNWFAKNAVTLPAIPLFDGGKALLQPTYVSDVADAIMTIIENGKMDGKTFELAGDLNFTWQEVADFTYDITYQKPRILDVPAPVGQAIASILQELPNPILTQDDVIQMTNDNVLDPSSSALTFTDLGIKSTPIQKVIFNYLYRFREGGHFPYAEGYH